MSTKNYMNEIVSALNAELVIAVYEWIELAVRDQGTITEWMSQMSEQIM